MSVKTILSEVGTELKKLFGSGVTEFATLAKDAEPLVDVAFPGVAALYTSTVSAVLSAETAAASAGAQSGTGAQKLAAVVAAITPTITTYASAAGLPTPTVATITSYANAVVASLNAIPAA